MTSLVWKGYKSELKTDDLWDSLPRDQSERLVEEIEKSWSPLAKEYLVKKRAMVKNGRKESVKLKDLKKVDGEDAVFLKKTSTQLAGEVKRPSLFFCILRVHYHTLLLTGLMKAIRDLCVLASPLVLG
jgi:hypothetical protein